MCRYLPYTLGHGFQDETKRDATDIAHQVAPQEAKPKDEAADTGLAQRVNPRRMIELANFNTKGNEAGRKGGEVQSL